jgi:tricorn protease
MRHPTINKTSIVFGFGGDLWSVPREGGLARRLTSAPGIEEDPYFSPDGKTIAFTARYDGNTDVFTVDSEGGIPKRLTYHPSGDLAAGWTPDGKSVVFSSNMQSNTDHPRLYSVPVTGGVPKALPFPSGTQVSYSPDGQRIAYMPGFKWQDAWKRYRGGQTSPIWVAQLSDSKVKEIPRKNTNDENPMWVGGKIFYTSDKQGPVGLYSYDVASGKVTEEVKPEGFDIKSASTGDGVIVYEKLGSIYEFNPATKVSRKVEIEIRGDFPEIRTQYKDLSSSIGNVSISPTGARVAVSARGWVLTVPASKGDARVLDETQGINRQAAAWSPDGKTVAYVKDDGTNHDLALFDLAEKKERIIAFPDKANYYGATGLHWSPDSKKIAVVDRKSQLTVVNLADGKGDVIDKATYTDPQLVIIPRWSPDSKWLTWARDLDSHMYAVFVHSFETGKNTQITDGLASANSPVFDRDGKHIYFTASTTVGLSASWLDMSSLTTPNVTSSVYAVVLKKDGKNPLEPESDEEKGKEPPKPVVAPPAGTPPAAPAEKKAESLIDLDGIESRIISLPLPTQIYGGLEAGPPGSFFALTSPPRANANSGGGLPTLIKFSFADRRAIPFASGVVGLDVTPDGTKALLQTAGGGLQIVSTMAPAPPGVGAVSLAGLTVKVDPKKEWRQMFDEIWKNEPIFFYSPTLHGIDAKAMHARYLPFVENLVSRADLNYLFSDMLGEICIGHMFISGGDIPGVGGVPGGLLGADYAFENGRYRLTKIYDGERWNPGLRAPLAQPGINAKVGEYVLAIDGKDLTDSNDIYEKLEAKAGKQVSVRLGPTPDGEDSREVTVVPVANEFALRSRAWAEDNRRAVEKGTNGRAGYVHIPDTGEGGWQSFNRYYYAQVGKDGMVIDERFNHGGQINDFMINEMQKTIHGVFAWRYGKDWPTPGAAIYGPKVMLINQFAGSGGDMFPWLFRHHKIGPLIGKRTWGGLVASFGFPILDGGVIRSPDGAFYDPFEGKWDVENHGVDPDIEVDMDPFLWRQGRDPQLERAIAEINKQLANWTPPKLKKPAFPIKSKVSDVDKRG